MRGVAGLLPLVVALAVVVPGPAAATPGRAAVSDVTLTLSATAAFESSSYSIGFRTGSGGALQPGDTVVLAAPTGSDFQDNTGWTLRVGDAEPSAVRVVGSPDSDGFTHNVATVTVPHTVPAGSRVTIRSSWVTNPGPSGGLRLSVSTSAEPTAARSAPYRITGAGTATWTRYVPSALPTRCWGSATGTQDCAARSYLTYTPPALRSGMPLVVELHGCFETAATEARWSRLHQAAAARDFVAMFPQQSPAANGGRCWNWFDPEQQHRGTNEPADIAAMVREVIDRYDIDPARVYVSGISAGGAMSTIMLATYPDLFAAGAIYAGCQYGGLPCLGAASAQPPAAAAAAAAQEMGPRLRSVPVFVIHGAADELVPVPNAEQIAQQWLAVDDIRRSGAPSVTPRAPTTTRTVGQPGPASYQLDEWRDGPCLLVQRWIVHAMAHQWSGAKNSGNPIDTAVTYPNGPDVTNAIVDFFFSKHMSGPGGDCQASQATQEVS